MFFYFNLFSFFLEKRSKGPKENKKPLMTGFPFPGPFFFSLSGIVQKVREGAA